MKERTDNGLATAGHDKNRQETASMRTTFNLSRLRFVDVLSVEGLTQLAKNERTSGGYYNIHWRHYDPDSIERGDGLQGCLIHGYDSGQNERHGDTEYPSVL